MNDPVLQTGPLPGFMPVVKAPQRKPRRDHGHVGRYALTVITHREARNCIVAATLAAVLLLSGCAGTGAPTSPLPSSTPATTPSDEVAQPSTSPSISMNVTETASGLETSAAPVSPAGVQVVTGDLQIMSTEGYELSINYHFELSDLAIDIANQPPGKAEIVAQRRTVTQLTNMTPGRKLVIDGAYMPPISLLGLFPVDSNTCEASGEFDFAPSINGGQFCALQFGRITTPRMFIWEWPVDGTLADDIEHPRSFFVVPEDGAEGIMSELDQPAAWAVFVEGVGDPAWYPSPSTGFTGDYHQNGRFILPDPSSASEFGFTPAEG